MAIPKLYPDVEQALRYPDNLGNGGTTQHEFQEFIRNIYGVLDGCVKSGGVWQPNSAVSAGDIVIAPEMAAGTKALVMQAGVTSNNEPEWGDVGTTITDGTVKYTIIPSYVLIATEEETSAGTDTRKAVSPAGLHNVTETIKEYVDGKNADVNKKIDDTKGELIKYADRYRNTTTYQRSVLPKSAKTKIIISPSLVGISNAIYQSESSTSLDLTKSTSWDNPNYIANTNRAGKDFYIYACIPDSGTEPKFILSANSTVPTGYTADNLEKLVGFTAYVQTLVQSADTHFRDI